MPPPHLQSHTDATGNPELLTKGVGEQGQGEAGAKRLPRETGQDIGMGSPVPLSSQAVGVITRLRNMKVCHVFLIILFKSLLSSLYLG